MSYVTSDNISVFPSANRANYPDSRLTNETNLTGLLKHITSKDSFVISNAYNNSDDFEFVLHGYYFKVKAGQLPSSRPLYASLKTYTYASSLSPTFEELVPYSTATQGSTVSGSNTYSGTASNDQVVISDVVVGKSDGSNITATVEITLTDGTPSAISTGITGATGTPFSGNSFVYSLNDDTFNVLYSITPVQGSNQWTLVATYIQVPDVAQLDDGTNFVGVDFSNNASEVTPPTYKLQLLDDTGKVPEESKVRFITDSTCRNVSIDDGVIWDNDN